MIVPDNGDIEFVNNEVARRREMHIAQHSLKCFTYGVPVRRYASEESDAKADKIKEL